MNKKSLYIPFFALLVCVALGLVSCSVETNVEPGGTAIEKMCGHWVVSVDIIEDLGGANEYHYGDAYGYGTFNIMTSNTSANETDKMWLIDNNFYGVKVKLPINYSGRTFGCDGLPYDADTTGYVTITNGKILEGAGTNIHGNPVDSIVFDCVFTDFNDGYTIRYSGIRYEGFYE